MPQFAYDDADRVTAQTLPGARTVAYAYVATGRLTSLEHPRGTSQFTYWDTPQPGTSEPSGQLKTITSPDTVTLAYAYDGPLLSSETWSGEIAGSVEREYDSAFRESMERVVVGATSSEAAFGYDDD